MTHRQRLSLIVVTLLAAFGLTAVSASAASAAPSAPPATTAAPVSTPVTGTFTDASSGTGSFVGTFTPTNFRARNGNLLATGTLTGTLTDSAGSTIGTVTRTVSLPTAVAAATCRVLDLTLGPLHLDLLGLVVDLNQVHLTINALPGGGLLGNLLCAIAGLLNGNPTAGTLAAILNFLLALLGQL